MSQVRLWLLRRCFLMMSVAASIACYYSFALGLGRLSLTLYLCGHRYSYDHWWSLFHVLHEGQVKIRKDFWCQPCFSNFSIWNSFQLSHTLRQPLLVIHDSKMSLSSWRSNLEVKKKSPLIGAGELKLKRESVLFMSPQYIVPPSPIAQLVEHGSSGRDVSFL